MLMLSIHSVIAVSRHDSVKKDFDEIVINLKLTDMALSTDARYTRHPTQADIFSSFQDYPGSPEHFPTGSIIPPPFQEFDIEGTVKIHTAH